MRMHLSSAAAALLLLASVGAVAAQNTVELHEVPNVKYRYTVVDNRTVLVDPSTRKTVKVYD
ncbi:DUF1236 domain-containing protein [Mesorhizobium sp. M7A.F.Ca.US.006.01.1.1]|uniref:DUF1236 domain-containing protein n=1 Tax=Mesorhizobium sp. M7A.F.Ca.US.006.01.1.1 TaxID=2496707 RepID=UPI000FC9D429|nr:DUF1236 domain-containing protein [Mesorhizobium sp. M7A.F.Ca.US.006.01.1.1]RUZ71790.1 DUF1236 domain-containing protein [Mesorhizobium sp. M7A.F.Ca.US.006.01.1.1]